MTNEDFGENGTDRLNSRLRLTQSETMKILNLL